MRFKAVIEALAIPRNAFVDQRVPKKLLVEQGAPTAADKRRIMDGIEAVSYTHLDVYKRQKLAASPSV